jgi:hypothetical protein
MRHHPLRDLTQHSLNAHEVLPRRDVHLAAAEAATFAVQMPCHNQCDRESAERCGAPHGERHTRWRYREMVERRVGSAWLLKERNFRKIDGHRDLWALATILGRQPVIQPIAGEPSVK